MTSVVERPIWADSEPHLELALEDHRDQMIDDRHSELVARVASMFQAAKADQKRAAPAYQPGGEWASYLAERQSFYNHLLEGRLDVAGETLRGFWRNELGPIVKEYARFDQLVQGERESVERFCSCVARNFAIWKEIFRRDPAELIVPLVGNPWGLRIEGHMVVPKATRFHALATQIADLARGIDRPLVADIGAGYGGTAYYLLRDHRTTVFVDFDLPETLVIAAYYLLACLPDRRVFLYGEGPTPTGSAWRDYDIVLLPNFEIPKLEDRSVNVLLNTFSFSEMPWPTLQEYMRHVHRAVRDYFLHNNMDRRGVVNRGFERIPASDYPIDESELKRIYKRFDLFHGLQGDYREFLYQRIDRRPC